MARPPLYRNIRARDQLDLFLVSAITSLLGVRLYLEITGYPQIGSGGLHIAHMLWGGFLMMGAVVVAISFIGRRAQQLSALLGGVGFGVFIDELGKFITKDNDYFFQPTIGLIYAIFVLLYLAFSFLSRDSGMTSREYQINALSQLEEAIALDLDAGEKQQVRMLLAKASQSSRTTKALRKLVDSLEISAHHKPGRLHRISKSIDQNYARFWRQKQSHRLAQLFFIAQAVFIFMTTLLTSYVSINDIGFLFDSTVSYGEELIIGQFLSAVVAAGLVLYGLYRLPKSRMHAFEQFRRSILVNLYLTQFFVFSRLQLDALPGLVACIILLGIVSFVLREERRLDHT